MQPDDDAITVLLAFDQNYAMHAAACMASLLRHSSAPIHFVVVSADDPAPFRDRLHRSFAREPRATLTVRRFEMPSGTHFPLPYHLTVETYMRFWIGEILPNAKRALYIDGDAITVAPIEPLWQTDLGDKVLGAVPIPGSTRPATHGMPPGSPFFNAGVLLFDLDAWRARGYRDRCLDYLRRHPERALDGDQDILNLCTQGDWLPLDYKWNVISPFYRPSHDLQLSPETVARVKRDARIIHFNGGSKPWRYLDNHPRRADYLSNRARTDWRNEPLPDRTLFNVLRKQVRPIVPAAARRAVKQRARTVISALNQR